MKKLLLVLAFAPLPALAHPGGVLEHGLDAGLTHPLLGMDHLVTMLSIGLWAGLLGARARLALPATFLAAMALGLGLGAYGFTLPGIEQGTMASALLLVMLSGLAVRLPLATAAPLVALFGVLHGHAHGTEGAGLGFAIGALVATAALHGVGLLLAAPVRRLRNRVLPARI